MCRRSDFCVSSWNSLPLTSFLFSPPATAAPYPLSLHDALPIWIGGVDVHIPVPRHDLNVVRVDQRSEEHTSELQSPCNLVCRLLLEKKKATKWAWLTAGTISTRMSK